MKPGSRDQSFRIRPATAADAAVHRGASGPDVPGHGPAAAVRHGIVLNVFTEPAWRRRGLAELLMRHVLEWARAQRLDRLVLHASAEGRALYERLGCVATNEMRVTGSLLGQDDRLG